MKIRLLPHHIYKILTAIITLNIVMLLGTWAFHFYYYELLTGSWEEASAIKHILKEFSLATENTIATWYSSMLFLAVAIMCAICFITQKKMYSRGRDKFWRYGWIMFFFIFATLSFDEMSSMHERLGDSSTFNPLGDYPLGWVFLLAIPIGIVAVLMLYFCVLQIKRAPWAVAFAIAGILLFISIPFQEYFEMQSWQASTDMANWKRPTFYLLLEEGSEIFGATFMFFSTILFVAYASNKGKVEPLNPSLKVKFSLNRKNLLVWLGIFSALLGIIMFLLFNNNTLLEVEGEHGELHNWFPSATAFLICLLALYIFNRTKYFSPSYRISCLFLAFLCLFLSAYFGSNMYSYFNNVEQEAIKLVFIALLFPVTILLAIRYFVDSKDAYRKGGFILWAILLIFALSFDNQYSAAIAYVAFSVLFITLFSRIQVKESSLHNPGNLIEG